VLIASLALNQEVQDDLLQLNSIAGHRRRSVRELRQQHDPISLQLAEHQCDDLARSLVEAHGFGRAGLLAEEGTQPGD